mgnify:CR=1 FL=1
MNVIIIGCGKLGSGLAKLLVSKKHNVTIIDSDPASFELLGENFGGTTMVGSGFSRDILESAGIKTADAIISCSKNDDANALIGRLGQNIYHVPCVISRLYDPRKAKIYRSLGIRTISTTTWGVERAYEMLSYDRLDNILDLGTGEVQIARLETPPLLVGRTVRELTVPGEIEVVAITSDNRTFIPTFGTVLNKNDIIFVSALTSASGKLKHLLGLN